MAWPKIPFAFDRMPWYTVSQYNPITLLCAGRQPAFPINFNCTETCSLCLNTFIEGGDAKNIDLAHTQYLIRKF